jgi:uncharacterized protein
MKLPRTLVRTRTVSKALKRLGSGLLGAIILLGAWIGVSAWAHAARTPVLVTNLALAAAGFLVYGGYVRATERRAVTELPIRSAMPQTMSGFAIGVALFAIVIGVLTLTGHYHVIDVSVGSALLSGLVFWLSGAIMEELLFRGFIFRVTQDVFGTWIAVAISAILFGLLHAGNPAATAFSSLAIALEAGVLLAVAFAATRRLWFPIGIHAGWNYAEGTIFGTAVSGGTVKGTLLHGVLSGSPLLTGGAFGVEASIIAIPVCLAAAALFAIKVKPARLVESVA